MASHEEEAKVLESMRRSAELARRSEGESGRTSVAPGVAVVITQNGKQVGESYRGRSGSGEHAEYVLLKELEGVDLSGATVFTTLEPCSRGGPGKHPCAERLVARRISTVYIGM